MASSYLREELQCSVCLDIYRNPVYLACGHNFCEICIEEVFENQTDSLFYTCPECRMVFHEYPKLHKNLKLGNIADHYFVNKANLEGEVSCSNCIDFHMPAVKRCLLCEVFLCEDHLKVHDKSVEHVLTEPMSCLVSRRCAIHKKPLIYYCVDEGTFSCVSCCVFGKHKGHQVESLNGYCEKKKEELQNVLETLISTFKEAETKDKKLQEKRNNVQEKSHRHMARINVLFSDMRKYLNKLENNCLSQITQQVDEILLQISDKIQQIDLQRKELHTKIINVKKLLSSKDPAGVIERCDVIQTYLSGGDKVLKEEESRTPDDVDDVLVHVTMQASLHKFFSCLPDLKASRGIILEDTTDTLLNINIAGDNVFVTNDMKSVECCDVQQIQPCEEKRLSTGQVFSIQSFSSGQYFWEVDTSKNGDWAVGLAYPSIPKTGEESIIGYNEQSWCLEWDSEYLSVSHNSECEVLSTKFDVGTVGIFLNCDDGRISFFLMTEPVRPLYTFTAKFTEHLHLAIYVGGEGWVRIRRH
ncbi:E3 ubiquitin/ISG15 ligase TRIM25-like [Discoglossus pictus]